MFAGEGSDKDSSPKSQEKDETKDKSLQEKEMGGAVGEAQEDMKSLKGNFEEQQAIIGQLREMLKSKEASRKQEKEIEDYATRLAKMKPRLIRRRGRERVKGKDVSTHQQDKTIQDSPKKESSFLEISEDTFQESPSSQLSVKAKQTFSKVEQEEKYKVASEDLPVSSVLQQESNTRSKILLLRKQLEENRIKFERQQRENLDKRATMKDMGERIEKLRMEVEQRDTLIQSLQEVDSIQRIDPNSQHLYQQIMHKDNTILDLTDKINHLEGVVHDQFEQINEKDQIITARTEAVTLISKDKDGKLMKTIQELEEVKDSLKSLQENYSQREKFWKEKEVSLEDNITLNLKKFSVMEDNYKKMESIRFELSARNAELQEKLVSLQSDSKNLREQCHEIKATSEQREEEIDELKKKLVRAEAFGQKKLKALEKQVKSLSSGEGDIGDQILELQNKIAELEEEKGNLQLKLVDFDEIKIQSEKLNEIVLQCESKIDSLNSEILSQVSTISKQEKEKTALVGELNDKDLKINNLEETILKQTAELDESKQSKVTLELRLCEIEEERDLAQKEKKDLENEYVKAKEFESHKIVDINYEDELKKYIILLEEKTTLVSELQESVKEKDTLLEHLEEEQELKQNENQCLISFLAEKESLITSQSIKIENHDSIVQSFQQEMSSKDKDIRNLHIHCENLQKEIDSLNAKLNESDLKVNELQSKINNLDEEVDANKESILLLEESEQTLKSALKEKDNVLQSFEEEILFLKEELTKKDESISSYINKIDHIDLVLQSREKQILNLESEIADKIKEISQHEIKCKKCEEQLRVLKQNYEEAERKLKSECEIISCLLSERENKVQVLNEQVEIKITQLKNSEIMCSKFEQEICDKNQLYDCLYKEKNLLVEELSIVTKKLQELESSYGYENINFTILQQSLEEKNHAYEALKTKYDENLDILSNNEEKLAFYETQNKTLENQLQEFKDVLKEQEYNLHQINNSLVNEEHEKNSLIEALNKKDSEISYLKQSLEISANKEVEEATEDQHQISRLENLISEKDVKIYELQQELEIFKINISKMSESINLLTAEAEAHKAQAEEFKIKLEESAKESLGKLQIIEQENHNLQKEIDGKNAMISQIQYENISTLRQSPGIETSHMQKELANKDEQIEYLKEIHRNEVEEIHSLNLNLKEELKYNHDLLSLKESDLSNLKVLYDESCLKMSQVEELEKSHFVSSVGGKDLEELKSKIIDLETEKLNLGMEINSLKNDLLEFKSNYDNLYFQYENLSYQLAVKEEKTSKTESIEVKDECDSKDNEKFESYINENSLLKKQLEEAQQAIIRLETSLATESVTQSNSQESKDEWGIVDLGEPCISDHSKSSMQTSLMEKDKALTVTQEQLKIALEEVNATNDDKKIIQHQMNTLEAELSHKDKKILNLENQIMELKVQISDTEKKSTGLTPLISGSQGIIAAHNEPEMHSSLSNQDTTQKSLEIGVSSWFDEDNKEELGSNVFDTIQKGRGQSYTFEQASVSENQDYANAQSSDSLNREEALTASQSLNQSDQSFQEISYKLSWYEQNWAQWTEHYNQLQINLQSAEEQIAQLNKEIETLRLSNIKDNEFEKLKMEKQELEESVSKVNSENMSLNELNIHLQSQIDKANQEIYRLKGLEAQVSEFQEQIQTLQHQCSVLEVKANDSDQNAAKVQEYEVLYGEVQTCMQEAETKREGSKSRVQELELMVESAESEISRLRQDLQNLTNAGKILEEERNLLQKEIEHLKKEMTKMVSDREAFEKENDRLQREAVTLHSQSSELQDLFRRNQGEIDQLKSEIEILEGENERNRSNYEILESELMRIRHENEGITQNNQIMLAEKESLETEIQRLMSLISSLTSERDHIRGEMQRLSEVATSAESEIARLKLELESLSSYPSKCQKMEQKYFELEEKLHDLELQHQKKETAETQDIQLEEVDWGSEALIEDEHLQRSSSIERNLLELEELKEKVISLEKEKNELNEEIQTIKLKNGKMIQKLKAANNKNENLLKEIQKLKAKAEGFSDLDMALEEEWKSRITKVEGERDELKMKVDEFENEKIHMKTQLDVLDMAQDKYLQLKEAQDDTIRSLSSRNENLASQITSLEWKISELEENLHLQQQSFMVSESSQLENLKKLSNEDSNSLLEEYKQKIISLEKEIEELKSENSGVAKINEELKHKLKELNNEKEELKSTAEDLRDARSKMETNCNSYKTSYLELHTDHETLQDNYTKINKELESIKSEQTTLKSAYDVLYEEYHQLQENRDSVRLELGIIVGERDKLLEEVSSLNNQLQALQEEEEEEIIRALQDECADLREQNNNLKDEIIRMNESVRQMEETVERTKHSLEQQTDIQEYLRSEIISKSQQNDSHTSTISEQDQQMKYMKAEIAALKTKSSQQQQALESLEPENEKLKKALESVQEQNKQQSKQIEEADVSLFKFASQITSSGETEKRFSSSEATELEAVLSHLHMKDLRCQQLSLEINKLLEERDGLQLKLSGSLRQNQDLTRELNLSQQLPSPQSPARSLSEKLAELRDLNSSLERKALDSFKGGSLGGVLPPSPPTFISHTAPATPTAMRHLDFTVTRENPGASSTIMNWLLGKSPPKEVLHV